MSNTITLKEYEFLQTKYPEHKNYVDEKTFEVLESFVLKEEQAEYLKLTSKKGFGKVLQAQNYVGLIQTQDATTIEIIPKIQNISEEESKKILLKMLKTLKKSPFKTLEKAKLKSSKMPLLEIFISMFLQELTLLVRKGIRSDYLVKEENLHFLKGKLKIAQQIKQNAIHKERFFVEYEEFSSDRVENRLIKTTLEFLYKKSKLNKNQQRIREFLFIFDDVSSSKNIKNDFKSVKIDRQMKEYEQILLWSKTFLLGNSFSPHSGKDIALALLFDMNLLFESYVGAYLKKKGLNVQAQDKGKYLVESPKRYALRPDFVLNKETENEIVADTKYKNIKEQKDISQADMYQLYAYGTKYKQTKQLYLIYPKGKEMSLERCSYLENELHLDVLFFYLSLGFEQKLFRENA